VEYLQSLLKEIGLQPERVRMFNLSAAMAGQFVEITKEMTTKIGELGPNPLRVKDGWLFSKGDR
jgi:coenzyme F420-reducing hydrogenase delta subunit